MKKTLKFILGALFAATLFISCGKAPVDEYGCFQQMEPALKNAQKKNQDVLVMITMNGDDDYSAKFINDVVAKDDFKKEILANYSTVLMDFSQTTYTESTYEDAFRFNPAIEKSATAHPKRADFFNKLDSTKDLLKLIDKELRPSTKQRIKKFYHRCRHKAKIVLLHLLGGVISKKRKHHISRKSQGKFQ